MAGFIKKHPKTHSKPSLMMRVPHATNSPLTASMASLLSDTLRSLINALK
jgi:hypothetical protein